MDIRDSAKYHQLLTIYRSMRIVVTQSNGSYLQCYMFPGHVVIFFATFLVCLYIVIRHTGSFIMRQLCVMWCSWFVGHYVVGVSLIWRIAEASDKVLWDARLARQGNGKCDRLELKAQRSLKLRCGTFGFMDKGLYLVFAAVMIEYTINSLLM